MSSNQHPLQLGLQRMFCILAAQSSQLLSLNIAGGVDATFGVKRKNFTIIVAWQGISTGW
jgi:hypothetical protein